MFGYLQNRSDFYENVFGYFVLELLLSV